jgi:hypothetical protein
MQFLDGLGVFNQFQVIINVRPFLVAICGGMLEKGLH